MKRWEYKIIYQMHWAKGVTSEIKLDNKLNELGHEGWELVGFDNGAMIFKGEISPWVETYPDPTEV